MRWLPACDIVEQLPPLEIVTMDTVTEVTVVCDSD